MTISLSPSKADTFLGCQRLYKFRYVDKIHVPESKYFLIGNIAHSACEDFHKAAEGNQNHRLLMSNVFKDAVTARNAFAKVESGLITNDDLFLIKDMLIEYVKYTDKNGLPTILSLEKSFSIFVDNIKINGRIDRIDNGGNTYCVVDYKTSSKPASKKEELDSVQLPTYGMYIRDNYKNIDKIMAKYIYLRHVNGRGVHEFEVDNAMMKAAEDKYRFIAAELAKPDCKYPRNTGYHFCYSCDYKRRCNLGE